MCLIGEQTMWEHPPNMMQWLQHNLDPAIFSLLGGMLFIILWLSIERWLYFRTLDPSQFASVETAKIETTRNLTLIASLAANAPYVGLLGTVLAIMLTFWQIGEAGNLSTQAIMLGLAMALKATAAGILVAIPGTLLYNALLRKAEVFQLQVKARAQD